MPEAVATALTEAAVFVAVALVEAVATALSEAAVLVAAALAEALADPEAEFVAVALAEALADAEAVAVPEAEAPKRVHIALDGVSVRTPPCEQLVGPA